MAATALITGAGSGIGRCIAIDLARNGHDLVLWDINEEGLTETSEQVRRERHESKVTTRTVDVADHAAVLKAFAEVKTDVGSVSRVVPAAGIARLDSLGNQQPKDAAAVFAINYHGAVSVVQAAYDDLIETKGAVVLIGSTESYTGGGAVQSYAASKHALLGFCRSAAIELGPLGVRINMVSPGTIKTPMYQPELMGPEAIALDKALQAKTPLRRLGQPEEIAKLVTFLLSDDNSYMTGSNVVIDGGLTA